MTDSGPILVDKTGSTSSFSRDKTRGTFVYVSYQGVVDLTPELQLVLGGSPDAKTTDFGGSCKLTIMTKFLRHKVG